MVPDKISGSGTRLLHIYLLILSTLTFTNRAFTGNLVGIPGQADTTILSYEYYLGRIDKVGINKDSKIVIIKGEPSETPVEPSDPEDAMLLATLDYRTICV